MNNVICIKQEISTIPEMYEFISKIQRLFCINWLEPNAQDSQAGLELSEWLSSVCDNMSLVAMNQLDESELDIPYALKVYYCKGIDSAVKKQKAKSIILISKLIDIEARCRDRRQQLQLG